MLRSLVGSEMCIRDRPVHALSFEGAQGSQDQAARAAGGLQLSVQGGPQHLSKIPRSSLWQNWRDEGRYRDLRAAGLLLDVGGHCSKVAAGVVGGVIRLTVLAFCI